MNEDYISSAAFHASLELNPPNPPAIIALLPLFYCFTFISSQYLDHLPQKPAKHSRSIRIWLDMAPTNLETSVDTASWGSSSLSRAAQVWLHSYCHCAQRNASAEMLGIVAQLFVSVVEQIINNLISIIPPISIFLRF